MMLPSLTVANFRCLEDLTLPELGRINLLVGKNNSGKTAVLEALRVLASGAAMTTLVRLGLERESLGAEDSTEHGDPFKRMLTGLFYQYDLDAREIGMGVKASPQWLALRNVYYQSFREEGQDGAITTRRRYIDSSDRMRVLLDGTLDDPVIVSALRVTVGAQEKQFVSFDQEVSQVLSKQRGDATYALFACAYAPAHPNDVDGLASLWDQIALTPSEPQVVRALQLIEPGIEGLTFVQAEDVEGLRKYMDGNTPPMRGVRRVPIVKLRGSDRRIPLRAMGDGLHRILDVVMRLVSVKSGCLLIDEFENGLHYEIHAKLWQLILQLARAQDVQVFATTHSDDCVRAFSEVAGASAEAEGVLYRIAKPSKGQTGHHVRRYSEQALALAADADVEVR